MKPELEDLRSVMHHQVDYTLKPLRRPTFFEDYKHRFMEASDVAELFHENTKQYPGANEKLRRSVTVFDRPSFKFIQARLAPDYRGHHLIPLPVPRQRLAGTVHEALQERRTPPGFREETITIGTLSVLLYESVGITGHVQVEDETKFLRAYPSAGALYPVEIYLIVQACDELPPGVYYYAPELHGLRSLEGLPRDALAGRFVDEPTIERAAITVVLTGVFWRSKAKYGPRGYRYTLQESGHIAANLGIAAESLGLATVPLGGFYDDALNRLLGVDGTEEAVVYAIAIGVPQTGDSDGE